jgi:hypothetical protein
MYFHHSRRLVDIQRSSITAAGWSIVNALLSHRKLVDNQCSSITP